MDMTSLKNEALS